jgi:hypothetical protein
MRVCPRCKHSTRELERIEKDKKTKKKWLITFCGKCFYNYELEHKEDYPVIKEEMDKPGIPLWNEGKFI